MPDITLARQKLAVAEAALAEARAALIDVPIPSPVIRSSDPWAQRLAEAPVGSTVTFAADFRADAPLILKKPLVVTREAVRELPQARIDPATPLPTFVGASSISGPDVVLNGIALVAANGEQTVLTDTGQRTILDRVRVLGSPQGAHRGILAHGQSGRYAGIYVAGITGSIDTQALCGWDGTRDLIVDDAYLEASGENVLFGGADAATADRMPTQIAITRSTLAKRPEWRTTHLEWTIKNIFEVKAGRDITLRDCLLENCWTDGQTGWAVVITPRNQGGKAPFTVVEDVLIEGNHIRNVGAGFQTLGTDDTVGKPSGLLSRLTIQNNEVEINTAEWPGSGRGFQLNRGSRDLAILHNRITTKGPANAGMYFVKQGVLHERFRVEDTEMFEGAYGIKGEGNMAEGVATPIK